MPFQRPPINLEPQQTLSPDLHHPVINDHLRYRQKIIRYQPAQDDLTTNLV